MLWVAGAAAVAAAALLAAMYDVRERLARALE